MLLHPLLLLSAIFACISIADAQSLNALQVLLPFVPSNQLRINYTLEVPTGCYNWSALSALFDSTDRPYCQKIRLAIIFITPSASSLTLCYPPRQSRNDQLVEVFPQSHCSAADASSLVCDPSCTRTAVIQSVAPPSPQRESTIIYATERASGRELRCDVFVDRVSRIEIVTRTRVLHLDDTEVFEIEAYDAEGNQFSSVEGLRIIWYIGHPDPGNAQLPLTQDTSVIEIVPFQESSLKISEQLRTMERLGLQGTKILMKGKVTGVTHVQAVLAEHAAQGCTVKIAVIDPFDLLPRKTVYLPPYGTFSFQLQTKQGLIALPSPKYQWSLSNSSVLHLVDEAGTVVAEQLGTSTVLVQDKNMTENRAEARCEVVEPALLNLYIYEVDAPRPHMVNWNLECGRTYEFYAELVGATSSEPLSLSSNVIFNVELPLTHLSVVAATTNRSYHVVTAEHPGTQSANMSISAIAHPLDRERAIRQLAQALHASQTLQIFRKLAILPAHVYLPLDVQAAMHQYKLSVTDGSGNVHWRNPDKGLVDLDPHGVVTGGHVAGSVVVTAVDAVNERHTAHAAVTVADVTSIRFLPSRVEAPVGDILVLPISVLVTVNGTQQACHVCNYLPLQFTLSDPSIFRVGTVRASVNNEGCALISFAALSEGQSVVSMFYRGMAVDVTIFAYHPLRSLVVSPVVVSLGSTANWFVEGGPLPWRADGNQHSEVLSVGKKAEVEVGNLVTGAAALQLYTDDRVADFILPNISQFVRAYPIQCLVLGEQTLVLTKGNKKTAENQFPVVETISVDFICAEPHSVKVTADSTKVLRRRGQIACPEVTGSSENQAAALVRNSRVAAFYGDVFDAADHEFVNASTLEFVWTLQSGHEIVHVMDPLSHDQKHLVQLSNQVGRALLHVRVHQYRQDSSISVVRAVALIPLPEVLENSLEAQLVHDVAFDPATFVTSIFYHPENTLFSPLLFGSGVCKVGVNDSNVVYLPNDYPVNALSLKPQKIGYFHLVVTDMCLGFSNPLIADVIVSRISALAIVAPANVLLASTAQAIPDILDINHKPFHPSQFLYMSLQMSKDTDSITIPREQELKTGSVTILGAKLGTSHLSLHAQDNGRALSSAATPVHVFSPLRALPSVLWLVPGAKFQLFVVGGPFVGARVEFSVRNRSVSMVDATGLVDAVHVGSAVLDVVSVGGKNMEYARTSVQMRVSQPDGLVIKSSSSRVIAGTSMRLEVFGDDQQTPFTFASAPAVFTWKLRETTLAALQADDSHAATLNTYAAGLVTVEVVATLGPVAPNFDSPFLPGVSMLSATSQLEIVEPLRLLSPKRLLLPSFSTSQIRTNQQQVSYSVLGTGGVVTVTASGQIRSVSDSGEAYVLVTTTDEHVNQTALIHVQVEPIGAHVVVSRTSLSTIPLGLDATFEIHCTDMYGRQMDSLSEVVLAISLSRYDVVALSELESSQSSFVNSTVALYPIVRVINGLEDQSLFTIRLRAVGEGIVVFRSSAASAAQALWTHQYSRIVVSHGLLPHAPVLHLGSVVCFTPTFDKEGSLLGDGEQSWHADDGQLILVNPRTGRTVAGQIEGRSTVHFNSSLARTHTVVSVAKVALIDIDVSRVGHFLTNYPTGSMLAIPIQFSPSSGSFASFSSCRGEAAVGVPFKCSLALLVPNGHNNNNIAALPLQAVASFDASTQRHLCQIFKLETPGQTIIPAGLLSVTVEAHDPNNTYSVRAEKFVQFVPAFQVSTRELVLTTASPSAVVTVHNAEPHRGKLVVVSGNPEMVQVKPLATSRDGHTVEIEVRALTSLLRKNRAFENVVVDISSQATQQTAQVSVSFRVQAQQSDPPASASASASASSSNQDHSAAQASATEQSSLVWLYTIVMGLPLCYLLLVWKNHSGSRPAETALGVASPRTPPSAQRVSPRGGNHAGFHHGERSPFNPPR